MLAAHAVVYYVVALTGWGFSGLSAATLACVVAFALLLGLRWLGLSDVERMALAGAAVCAVGLAIAGDLHGISLTSGGLVMLALLAIERKGVASHRAS